MLCSYGCGREAIKQFKNGMYCCIEDWRSCPGVRKRIGDNNSMKKSEVAKKNGDSKRGRTEETYEYIRRVAEKRRGRTKENDESVRRMAEKKSAKMTGNEKVKEQLRKARKQIKNPSDSELKLRGIVKELYPTSEYSYKVLEDRDYEVDNAIPEYKIVVEYDGYFHFDTEEHKEYHKRRQEEIEEEEGWKFLRYNIFQKFPTLEQVKEDIQSLVKKENVL